MRFKTNQLVYQILFVLVILGFPGDPLVDSLVGDMSSSHILPIRDCSTRAVINELIQSPKSVQEIEDTFKSGDTIAHALGRHLSDQKLIQSIIAAAKSHVSLNRINAGTRFTIGLLRTDRTFKSLRVKLSKEKELLILADGSELKSELNILEPVSKMQKAESIIRDSLWNSARSAQLPASLIMDMADLFGCKIDFACDVVSGDSFKVYYTIRMFPDGATDSGFIHAATFKNAGTSHFAFRYEVAPGKIDYYDQDGNLIRNRFLKSPLRFRYISSGFTNRRLHPILNTVRPHYGVDYAAPSGTPVCSIGDGEVIFAARAGGYGNCVKIKHGSDYISMYNHLSKYGNGIRKGTRVQQGQIIGYVGSTGLSTGPHLDFRVMHNGTFINPLNLKSSPGEPLPESLRNSFFNERDRWLRMINEGV